MSVPAATGLIFRKKCSCSCKKLMVCKREDGSSSDPSLVLLLLKKIRFWWREDWDADRGKESTTSRGWMHGSAAGMLHQRSKYSSHPFSLPLICRHDGSCRHCRFLRRALIYPEAILSSGACIFLLTTCMTCIKHYLLALLSAPSCCRPLFSHSSRSFPQPLTFTLSCSMPAVFHISMQSDFL